MKINFTAKLFETDSVRRLSVDTNKAVFSGMEKIKTGYWIKNVWVGRKYVICKYFSQWMRQNGYQVGEYFVAYDIAADKNQILEMFDRFGLDCKIYDAEEI